jgi:uncharacterized protein DUF3533
VASVNFSPIHESRVSPGRHAAQRTGPWMRYRAQYAKLPPAIQMIGLQLWLPFVFVIAFSLCYVASFHHPVPKHVPVALVGPQADLGQAAQRLEANSGGVLSVSVYGSAAKAQEAVRDGDLAAAFTPGTAGARAVLTIASGAQFQLATMAKTTFASLATAEKTTLTVDDLAPLTTADSSGTASFYVALVWTIAGYMVAMFVGMLGAPLKHRVRLGIIAGGGLVLSFMATLLTGPIVGAFHGHFATMWLTGWCTAVAIGLMVNGLAYFLGRFVTGAALLLFVFLNVPASGGAFPREFVPAFFDAIHPYVIGAGVLDVIRSLIYGAGPGAGAGALVIGAYAVVGALVTLVGKPYAARRARRHAELGKPISMMHAAQGAAMAVQQGLVEDDSRDLTTEDELGENEYAAEESELDAAAAVS